MLSDDEAVVVVLGLIARARLGLDSADEPVDGALAKIHRVLPATLRRQVEALEQTLGFTAAARPAARRSAAARCCCWPTRSGAGGACTPATARSRARQPSAISARTASSCTRGAGTSPRTTTAATTCARSASTA